jgi:ubiquinone/menaquinone biosynthesis C-methylase UbiE
MEEVGYNKFKNTPDNHDFMTEEHIADFLRNHKTGTDNMGRRGLAQIVSTYDNPKVLDIACGTCVNWEVFKLCGVKCNYVGLDRTEGMLKEADKRYGDEITLHRGYAQETELPDDFADVVIIRHILEHLQEGYEDAIREGIRLASKELILVFFLDLSDQMDDHMSESDPDENGCTYFWNTYSNTKLMNFLSEFGYRIQVHRVVTLGAAHADTIVRIIK